VYTHLELRSVREQAGRLEVDFAPGLPLSRLDLEAGRAKLLFKEGRQVTTPVQCDNRLDYAEPRELLRSFLE
jgi:hypothetical protein